jgi:hypothetical protein
MELRDKGAPLGIAVGLLVVVVPVLAWVLLMVPR